MTFFDGEKIDESSYDIPDSHDAHVKLDKDCPCENGDLEYGYPDCPVTDPNYFYDEENFGWFRKEDSTVS